MFIDIYLSSTGETDTVTEAQCKLLTSSLEEKHQRVKIAETLEEFFIALCICNTVVVSEQPEVIDRASLNSSKSSVHQREDSLRRATYSMGDVENKPRKRQISTGSLDPTKHKSEDNGYVNGHLTSNWLPTISSPPTIVIEASGSPMSEDTFCEVSEDVTQDSYLPVTLPRTVRINSNRLSDRLSRSIDSINSWLNVGLAPKYEAESPDEAALVKAANHFGYKLANRTPDQIFFTTPKGDIRVYDILQILQFDSARKRMSIIVRDDSGRIKMYTKGADTAILFRLHDGQG